MAVPLSRFPAVQYRY